MILQCWMLGTLSLFSLLAPVRASSSGHADGGGAKDSSLRREERTPILGGSLNPRVADQPLAPVSVGSSREWGGSLGEESFVEVGSHEVTIAERVPASVATVAPRRAVPRQRDYTCEDRLSRTVLCIEVCAFLTWLLFMTGAGVYNFITGEQ